MKKFLKLALCCFTFFCAAVILHAEGVKYVFLFIGDGMSFPQRMMADEYSLTTGGSGLLINTFPVQTASRTRSTSSFITDSAAAGTAIACGEKTMNGRIGMDATGKRELESMAFVAQKAGKKVGIITSVTINHATPAAFYAHNVDRGNYFEIAKDMITAGFDYYGGGGIQNPVKNGEDVYELAKKAGYHVCKTVQDVKALPKDGKKAIATAYPGIMPYALDKTEEDLRLDFFVRQALDRFEGHDKGFFIMCEGGAIDWLCHANDAAGTVQEVLEFDAAVAVAFEFYKKHPNETLIVITGDHETGGMTLGFNNTGYTSYIRYLSGQKMTNGLLAASLRALKPAADKLTWDELKVWITGSTGLLFTENGKKQRSPVALSPAEEAELKALFIKEVDAGKIKDGRTCAALSRKLVLLLNNKSSIGWTSGHHTGLPVNTSAIGKSAEKLAAVPDNTDIAKVMKELLK